jgi:hypothetical protein
MNRIVCYLIILCLIGGYLGFPLAVSGERGLTLNGVSVADQQGHEVLWYSASYALVIGMSEYVHWSDLPGVEQDVQEVQAALESHGFEVISKMNLNKQALTQAFDEFISAYGHHPDHRLVIYFAGHGHTLQLAYGGEMGYIVPTDAPLPHSDASGFLATAMDMQMIEVYAKRIQAKHALFVFDSCFSGAIFAMTREAPEHIAHKTANPVRQFMTSGSANEPVPDESIFRSQFIAALNGDGDSNQDGYVTGAELGLFLENTVINYSKGTQHPQYGKIRDPYLDKGDFVFKLPEQEVKDLPGPPERPPGRTFSFEDLEAAAKSEEHIRADWHTNLSDMEDAFATVTAYEQREISAALKIAAWDRFLQTFAQDNPYAHRDEELRRLAREQIVLWKTQRVPTPRPTPRPTPTSMVPTPVPVPTTTPKASRPTVSQKTHLRSKPLVVARDEAPTVFGLDADHQPRQSLQHAYDAQGEVVIDHATGLMWQTSGFGRLSYTDAHAYIDHLNSQQFAGFMDWRLPTVEELLSLMEPEQQDQGSYISSVFVLPQLRCWSADTESSGSAWFVDFKDKHVYWNVFSHGCVLGVRSW